MMRSGGLAACLAICLMGGVAAAPAVADDGGHTLQNARLTIVFGSTANGYTTNDTDRVDAITWINSAGTAVTNYVTSGGPLHCGDPQEFFGEAYGDTGDTGVPLPNAVVGGVTALWSGASALQGTASIRSLSNCGETLDAKTKTQYRLFPHPGLVSSLQIIRSFAFAKKPASGNMRAYVPRLPLNIYPITLAPNAAGVVQTYNVGPCPLNCTVTDWNGRWMADDDGNGNGMAIFRDPTTNPPAQLTIDWDGYSSSNNSAITIIMPAAGFKGTVTETEYLCFYDAKSWTAKARAAGKPPGGCTGVPH